MYCVVVLTWYRIKKGQGTSEIHFIQILKTSKLDLAFERTSNVSTKYASMDIPDTFFICFKIFIAFRRLP